MSLITVKVLVSCSYLKFIYLHIKYIQITILIEALFIESLFVMLNVYRSWLSWFCGLASYLSLHKSHSQLQYKAIITWKWCLVRGLFFSFLYTCICISSCTVLYVSVYIYKNKSSFHLLYSPLFQIYYSILSLKYNSIFYY